MGRSESNWLAVGYGLGLSVLAAYQLFKLPPVLPVLLDEHGYDRALAGGFMSVYAVTGLALSLVVGRALEERDPRFPVLAGLALLALGNLLALWGPATGLAMLAARTVEGLGFAVLAVAGPLLANRAAGPRHLPMVVAATAAWIPAGQVIATLLAAALVPRFDWQFLWLLGLSGTAAMALALLLAGSRLGFERSGTARKSGAAKSAPGLPAAARQGLWLGSGIFMLWSCQFFAFMTWLPQFLIEGVGLGLSGALMGYLLPVCVLMAFNLITGVMLRAGLSLGALMGVAVLLQAMVWVSHPWIGEGAAGVVLLVAYGIGAGITPTCLFALPSTLVGPGGASRAFGALMTGRNIGVLVGPVLLAEAFKATGNWTVSAPIFGGVTVLAACLVVPLSARLRAARA